MQEVFQVAIIDDDKIKRESMRDEMELENWKAIELTGPFAKMEELTERVLSEANRAVCDHHFVQNYAEFNGAETVAQLYQHHLPAVLVTQYEVAEMLEIREYRRYIPVLLTPREADPDTLARAWEMCGAEFNGVFVPIRKPWETLVLITDVSDDSLYVLLPGWNSDEVIRVPRRLVPVDLTTHLQAGNYLFATVNKGAERQSELFFEDFKYRDT